MSVPPRSSCLASAASPTLDPALRAFVHVGGIDVACCPGPRCGRRAGSLENATPYLVGEKGRQV
eukprot:3155668-Alexandrium_andersonii.AAC.1